MTGPSAYTKAINECKQVEPQYNYREVGSDYEGNLKFHYHFSKFFLYGIFKKNGGEDI